MLNTILNLLSLAAGLLGAIAGYVSTVYWLDLTSSTSDAAYEQVHVATPILVALLCGLLPYCMVRLAGDVLTNAYVDVSWSGSQRFGRACRPSVD